VQHISRDENTVVNDLAHEASSFRSNREKIGIMEKSDVPIFSQCTMQQSVLLNKIQQNRMVQFQKPKDPKFPGTQTIRVKWQSIMMIEGHPWYVI
jgi:hypothetical protein